MSADKKNKIGSVLIVGGGIGGMQAALDLADSEFKVHIVQKESSIGGTMSMLDKTFPTGDCAMCMISPKMVEVGRHRNIDVHATAELIELKGSEGDFTARIRQKARYVDISKCTGCEECVKKCPVESDSDYNQGLAKKTAINRRYAQAVPGAVAIDKLGTSPCRIDCPGEVNAHAYVALTAKGRFAEALEVIRRTNPFPAACGRVCTHPCEDACRRKDLDEAVSICYLKRFLTDWEDRNGGFQKPVIPEQKLEKVAVIGAGPGGLTCARDLALKGYKVTVFEKEKIAGGALALYIPEYRLPKDVLKREIDTILSYGIELKLNQTLGKDFTIDSLKKQGYKAIFVAIGTHRPMKLNVPGEDKQGVWDSLAFLKKANTEGNIDKMTGEKVLVIGGGNAAIDSARAAKRMGADVTIIYRRSCEEMPCSPLELEESEIEGVHLHTLASPIKILGEGKVTGIECLKMHLSEPDESGRLCPVPVNGSNFTIDCDIVITAISQQTEHETIEQSGITTNKWKCISIDENTLATNIDGVFAGGDVVTGPSTVIEAIGMGSRAAKSIHKYLSGSDLMEGLKQIKDRPKFLKNVEGLKKISRRAIMKLLPSERESNFKEVELGFNEKDAVLEAQRCLNCTECCECYLCVDACEAKAIDHDMATSEDMDIKVGSVILSPGLDRYDARLRGELGYGRWPNVVTSLQFERILSASGPYKGVVQRPSDKKHPRKVAWIQCVGSRDSHNANPWCSSVCCMYATKQAIIAKEHDKNIEPAIFFMEMRTFGKDFDKYVERAKNEYDVRYQRAMVSAVREEPSTGNLVMRYAKEDGALVDEIFDMVVLSVGLQPHKDAKELAELCGIDTDIYNFPKTSRLAPVDSSRKGVFVTGIYQGPKDIPETVMQGSAVAGRVMSLLSEARGTETKIKEIPDEKNTADQEPRIGVFVCHCGTNIAGTVDVKKIVEEIKDMQGVVYAEDLMYSCAQDSQEKIKHLVREKNLNRVLVASCTPRTHEPLFQETIQDAGLNKYLFDLADIREQCSWCHMGRNKEATEKALKIVKMELAKTRLLEPLKTDSVGVVHACMIIGGGVAGMTAALSLADQGFDVHIVEKENQLGGLVKKVYRNIEGDNIQEFLKKTITAVSLHKKITVHTGVEIKKTEGFVGNFKTTLTDNAEFEHGAIIVATGGVEYTPVEYLYKKNDKVVTQRELEEELAQGRIFNADESIVMIQCVGSREEPNQYCSRICCQDAVKNAIAIKEKNPHTAVIVLYRDIRTYGLKEDYYKKARDSGVIFIRYDVDKKPEVQQTGDNLFVKTWDYILNKEIILNSDLLVLSTGFRPHPTNDKVGEMYKLTRNADGYFLEAHVKLRPVDFPSEGVFVCGLAHAPKNIEETIAQAQAAAGRAGVILSHKRLAVSGIVAKHNKNLCMSCLTCFRLCPFGSPYIDENGKISHNEVKCMGCGICAGICPAKAFHVNNFRDDQILAMIDSAAENNKD
ncbi:MAG: FAD-dependent oxidoreductase [Nitrospiraceae bacterium]|nr:FAD-dependent oxidoreductase [Nitrospiraceae bacterium]